MSAAKPAKELRPPYQFRDPFDAKTNAQLDQMAEAYSDEAGLGDYKRQFRRGARLAHSATALDDDGTLLENERDELKLSSNEHGHLLIERRRSFPGIFKPSKALGYLVFACSMGAAVQGWDESAINGAAIYFQPTFGISDNHGLTGLINGAPYACCVLACLLTPIMNKFLGRRGTICFCCIASSASCLAQGFTSDWKGLLAARCILGVGIGPKSATIPIYAAESAPAHVRGALVMMWQVWTAFGIMCGYLAGVAFSHVLNASQKQCDINDKSRRPGELLSTPCSLHWRLTLASPMILPFFVALLIWIPPESPRYLLRKALKARTNQVQKKYHEKAWKAMQSLRRTDLQAARDILEVYYLLKQEEVWEIKFEALYGLGYIKALLGERRNRRAFIASTICMFLQQFCGVNVMVYYSSTVFKTIAGYSENRALLASMGFGIINFVGASPSFWLIDRFGRRNLLLCTFPLMALFQLLIGIGALLRREVRGSVILVGMYLFCVAYSPGEGPVPFVYAAESMPLYIRDFGMGLVTAINWALNFLLAITWPSFSSPQAFHEAGAFFWYAAWCFVGFWLVLFLVPETKRKTLEQLDEIFDVPWYSLFSDGLSQLKGLLRKKSHDQPDIELDGSRESVINGSDDAF